MPGFQHLGYRNQNGGFQKNGELHFQAYQQNTKFVPVTTFKPFWMQLSKTALPRIAPEPVIKPPDTVFDLPEKVLQFGTGVLLRALPDYFIDKANRAGSSTDGS
jgi:hypothetical protein